MKSSIGKTSSPKLVKLASKTLRSSNASKAAKRLAGSVLSQSEKRNQRLGS